MIPLPGRISVLRFSVFLSVTLVAATAVSAQLTPVPVDIDPLGAEGDVPWKVHYDVLNVRTQPTTSGSSVLGQLLEDQEVVGDYYVVQESDEEWIQIRFQNQDAWIARVGVSRVHPTNQTNIDCCGNLAYGTELVNRWWGIPIEYEPDDLVALPSQWGLSSGRTYRLRSEAMTALLAMFEAAQDDGVDMLVLSDYRSGPTQKSIYDNAVSNDGLSQRYSAPPGHSEHQLGTTVDIASPVTRTFIDTDDPQYPWLVQNAADYGFRQTYTADNVDDTGYIEEPWHWRYIGLQTSSGDVWFVY